MSDALGKEDSAYLAFLDDGTCSVVMNYVGLAEGVDIRIEPFGDGLRGTQSGQVFLHVASVDDDTMERAKRCVRWEVVESMCGATPDDDEFRAHRSVRFSP